MSDLSSLWEPFWSALGTLWEHFGDLGVIFGVLWLHFLCEKADWAAKGAPGAPQGAHPRNKLTFWEAF